jgi:hypothetical protein
VGRKRGSTGLAERAAESRCQARRLCCWRPSNCPQKSGSPPSSQEVKSGLTEGGLIPLPHYDRLHSSLAQLELDGRRGFGRLFVRCLDITKVVGALRRIVTRHDRSLAAGAFLGLFFMGGGMPDRRGRRRESEGAANRADLACALLLIFGQGAPVYLARLSSCCLMKTSRVRSARTSRSLALRRY